MPLAAGVACRAAEPGAGAAAVGVIVAFGAAADDVAGLADGAALVLAGADGAALVAGAVAGLVAGGVDVAVAVAGAAECSAELALAAGVAPIEAVVVWVTVCAITD